ncbi:Sjogren's syndrome/scleroderma autoantigen 1 family protein [Salinilacihabitans rarus]|uniref:Sjogren's syndrome/scleroderma autoantigen 1 family protein n=1 Tax=Salinilacihabitans rarus TaxID=2961596 RepID=UPI0020C8E57C|nr:Sjogren's syndrome/scleroderma autoantigen 1 family protein [Salinilacihabitans rarus]
MSDFDKEAEREKLREKYERDEADREATRRMSDLLLKGATMTNTHCGTCGDPLFRQDGVTFCPTCHGGPAGVEGPDLEREPEAAGAEADRPDAEGETEAADASTKPEPTDATGPGGADSPSEIEVATAASDPADASPGAADAAESGDRTARASESSADRRGTDRRGRDRPAASSPAVSGDLEAGRDALVAALERFAREAAETDDPRYALECLEAAREASEALAALRG